MNANFGYVGYSYSKNAELAYENGEKPLSKWKKSEIIKEVVSFGSWTEDDIKGYRLETLCSFFLKRTSWHHTSKHFNKTDFYDINIAIAEEKTDERVATLAEYAKEDKLAREKKANCKLVKGSIIYEQWEGSRRNGKFVRYQKSCIIAGNWAYTLSGKKDIYGVHVLKVERYDRAPKGTAAIYKEIEKTLPKNLRK